MITPSDRRATGERFENLIKDDPANGFSITYNIGSWHAPNRMFRITIKCIYTDERAKDLAIEILDVNQKVLSRGLEKIAEKEKKKILIKKDDVRSFAIEGYSERTVILEFIPLSKS